MQHMSGSTNGKDEDHFGVIILILAVNETIEWVFRSIRPVISFHSGHVFR
jgi:hypothetical protein